MRLEIYSEGCWSFDIKADDVDYYLAKENDGGGWWLSQNGSRVWMGQSGAHWRTALNRALSHLQEQSKAEAKPASIL